MSWRKPETRDLAAKLSQKEMDMYRIHPDFQTGTDPVADLLELTAESVRGFCRTNKQVKMCPAEGTIPESMMTFAMDFAAYDVLTRINVKVNDDRKSKWEKAQELFEKVAKGEFIPESWKTGEEVQDDTQSNRAMPTFGIGRRKILNEYKWNMV